MTKTKLLNQFASDESQRLLLARMLDKRSLCESRQTPQSTGFLTPEEQELCERMLRQMGDQALLFGGYADAQRRICGFLPSWMEEESFYEENSPILALKLTVAPMAELSHRDYLGALMGLGISREKFGDILPQEGGCQLILLKELLPVLEQQWESVGRYPVKLEQIPLAELAPQEQSLRRIRDTVASLRLDAVVAAGFQLSRSRGAELIVAGKIQRNHRTCDKTDALVEAGDVFSCRGKGKFVLAEVLGKSKKDRIMLAIDRYE